MNFYWFIQKSIILDISFLRICSWSFENKMIFLFKKYYEISKYILRLKKFKLGNSYISLFGKKIFYDTQLGLAGYQSILTRHNHLLKIAEIRNVKHVIDVGANVGFFSLLVRELFPKSIIYAIEPANQTYVALQLNFRNDKNIKLIKTAISNKKGHADLFFDPKLSAISSLKQEKDKIKNSQVVERVETITLDSLLTSRKIPVVDILKIDVESFEKQVLQGAKETLRKTRYLFLEITIEGNSNYTFSEINSLLFSKDFNFQLVGFRNYADVGEGKLPLGDFLYKNINLS